MKYRELIGTAAVLALAVAQAGTAQNPQSRGIGQAKAAAAATQSAGQQAQRPSPVPQRERDTAGQKAATPAAGAPGGAAKPAGSKAAADKSGPRDPFVSTIKPPVEGDAAPQFTCPAGVRGIIVGQAELNGVARSATEMIAVITTTNTNRTYFLRQGAQLCNGTVTKITDDSIIFEENAIDPAGRPVKREVIKKIPTDAK